VIATQIVQTTGVNWESVATITGLVSVVLTFTLWAFSRQDKRRAQVNRQLRDDMTKSLDHLSDVLLAKLETKDTVARISERLARVEALIGVNGSRE